MSRPTPPADAEAASPRPGVPERGPLAPGVAMSTPQPPSPLERLPLTALVEELNRRCDAAVIALRLDGNHSHPESDVRIFMHCRRDHSLTLAGLADLAHADVIEQVRTKGGL